MSARVTLRTFVAASVLLTACSETPTEPGPSAPSGPGAGAGGSSAALVDAGAGAANSAGAQPVSVGSAVPTTVSWKVIAESQDSTLFAYAPVAASRGPDAAVAYYEWASATAAKGRVVLQRFDAAGQRVGELVQVSDASDPSGDVTLASDGSQYAACYTAALELHCSLIDDQGQVQLNALTLTGRYPTIVASPSGWAIGYQSGDTQLRLQGLTPALELNGSPVDLELSSQFKDQRERPLLSATPSGFALVGARLEDGHDALLRLGTDLKPAASPIPLGRDFWFFAELVASDTRAAVSLSTAYGSYLLLLDTHQVTAEVAIAGGNKEGIDQALMLSNGGIAAAWLGAGQSVLRRFFANGADAQVGLGTHDMPRSPINTAPEGSDTYQQLLSVGDQTLLVGRSGRGGPLINDLAIRVAALSLP